MHAYIWFKAFYLHMCVIKHLKKYSQGDREVYVMNVGRTWRNAFFIHYIYIRAFSIMTMPHNISETVYLHLQVK